MSAAVIDRWGAPIQASNGTAVAHFDDAVEQLVGLSGDPQAAVETAIAIDDTLALAHLFRAYLFLYSTTSNGVQTAVGILKMFDGTDAALNERELLHLRAARAWASGDWDGATHFLERAILHNSRDLLAIKLAQDLYFLLGQTRELQGVVSRVRRAWTPERPGWGYIQGMFAFGLEETGEYAQAEVFARAALHHNAKDTWAAHALAHVLAMESRAEEGVAFLTETASDWSSSYFAPHLWWHKALFHLDLGKTEAALSVYDEIFDGAHLVEWLDLVDAASLLWRLSLLSVDVTSRAEELADDLAPLIDDPIYIFNDWHAVMAFGLAGRHELSEQLLASNRRRTHGTNKTVAEQAGLALLEGFHAFASGNVRRTSDVLTHVQPLTSAVGGSHIQREIVSLTIDASTAHAAKLDSTEESLIESDNVRPLASIGRIA